MRWWLVVGSAVGCGVPKARYVALEDGFDAAAAARDRSLAELDACQATARERTARDEAAEAPDRAVEAALTQLAERGLGTVAAGGLALDPAVWFVDGAVELSEVGLRQVPALAAGLSTAPGVRFRLELSAGDVPASREYPTPWHLAADRAVSLTLALVAAGLPPDRIAATAVAGPAGLRVVSDRSGGPGSW